VWNHNNDDDALEGAMYWVGSGALEKNAFMYEKNEMRSTNSKSTYTGGVLLQPNGEMAG